MGNKGLRRGVEVERGWGRSAWWGVGWMDRNVSGLINASSTSRKALIKVSTSVSPPIGEAMARPCYTCCAVG